MKLGNKFEAVIARAILVFPFAVVSACAVSATPLLDVVIVFGIVIGSTAACAAYGWAFFAVASKETL